MATQPIMLRLVRPFGISARKPSISRPAALTHSRGFAERNDAVLSSDPSFSASSKSAENPNKIGVPLGPGGPGNPAPNQGPTQAPTPATPSSTSSIPPQKVPLAPPSPSKVQTAPPSSTSPTISTSPLPPAASTPPPPAPPPPAPKSRFRLLRVLFYLILATATGYGGAVFYALRSDNFHDFFTEYIPFGEEAVLYFEERSFQKRFPNSRQHLHRTPQSPRQDDTKVTIPWKSGLSWKVSDEGDQKGSDLTQKGKHMSAVEANVPSKQSSSLSPKPDAKPEPPKDSKDLVQAAKKELPDSGAATPKEVKETPKKQPEPSTPETPATASPKSDPRPPAIAPITQVSPLEVPNAEEPVVQELVKIVNDLITVVNADSAEAANKYSAPMNKAKESLSTVAQKITALRDAERKAAEERLQQAHKEFDEGAKQLLQRIETAQREDNARYQEEFEAERAKIAQGYDERLKTEVERSTQITEQRLKNELAEQAIEMKRQFVSDVQSLVESERDGRLSKLDDLSTNVDSLTQLTSNWNGVIDVNLATQKLQVAVDAVRSALANSSSAEIKPKPFVREMAALKLVADGDGVVDAAIASVNPAAYQRGIPSQPQLIDRFRRVASEVRKASLLPEDAGVASHAASFILSKVMFKKYGQPQGGDVESILTRTETLLEEGDLDSAAREMNELQGWAKILSRDWLGDVRKVLEVRQALEVIETEARLQCLRVE